ncbi:MAG: hypothetical protein QOD67_4291, partial [Caballeronia sp.]|nr:hypothetical protein [Caballeronia sp.]
MRERMVSPPAERHSPQELLRYEFRRYLRHVATLEACNGEFVF